MLNPMPVDRNNIFLLGHSLHGLHRLYSNKTMSCVSRRVKPQTDLCTSSILDQKKARDMWMPLPTHIHVQYTNSNINTMIDIHTRQMYL